MISPGNMTPSDILTALALASLYIFFLMVKKSFIVKHLCFPVLKANSWNFVHGGTSATKTSIHIQFCPKEYNYDIDTRIYLGFASLQ